MASVRCAWTWYGPLWPHALRCILPTGHAGGHVGRDLHGTPSREDGRRAWRVRRSMRGTPA